jgi:hypothetical protein
MSAMQARDCQTMSTDTRITRQRIHGARAEPAKAGILDGTKDTRVTIRVQDRLLRAVRERTGITSETERVTASLALLAAQDNFGAWLIARSGRLTDDFGLGL